MPFGCGVLALFAFLHFHPVGARVYGAFSAPAQVAVLVGQIVIPSLGGPLLGVALGRWARFPGAALVLFLVIFGWVNVATAPDLVPSGLGGSHGTAAVLAVRVLHDHQEQRADVTTWRGSPWFFIGWQLALCATAVLTGLRPSPSRRALG